MGATIYFAESACWISGLISSPCLSPWRTLASYAAKQRNLVLLFCKHERSWRCQPNYISVLLLILSTTRKRTSFRVSKEPMIRYSIQIFFCYKKTPTWLAVIEVGLLRFSKFKSEVVIHNLFFQKTYNLD